ncbi:MAG: hypothetical protein FE78DRAFT_338369 [Acidomyces sp. 'richmondensis']|nr:MAG: hypothetical protein FE78DRAFT_338369 [Acidomyces sp. 'richmondensis']
MRECLVDIIRCAVVQRRLRDTADVDAVKVHAQAYFRRAHEEVSEKEFLLRDSHVILSLKTAPAFRMLGALEIYVASTSSVLHYSTQRASLRHSVPREQHVDHLRGDDYVKFLSTCPVVPCPWQPSPPLYSAGGIGAPRPVRSAGSLALATRHGLDLAHAHQVRVQVVPGQGHCFSPQATMDPRLLALLHHPIMGLPHGHAHRSFRGARRAGSWRRLSQDPALVRKWWR